LLFQLYNKYIHDVFVVNNVGVVLHSDNHLNFFKVVEQIFLPMFNQSVVDLMPEAVYNHLQALPLHDKD